jgi:curli biogenesis system outer membrane secretion channel CsgG
MSTHSARALARPTLATFATLLSLASAQAIAAAPLRAQAADTAHAAPVVPRSQRPSLIVMPFEFNATLSDEDRADLNSVGALVAAMQGQGGASQQQVSHANLGRGIADQLVAALLDTKNFRVMERRALETVLAEQNLVAGDKAAPTQQVSQQARILGAQYLVTGSITKFGREKKRRGGVLGAVTKGVGGVGLESNTYSVGITLRVVDASTGEVVGSMTSDGEVKGGRKLAIGGFGGGGGGGFASSNSGEREKKIAEAINIAVASLSEKLVDLRVKGDLEAPPARLEAVVPGRVAATASASGALAQPAATTRAARSAAAP